MRLDLVVQESHLSVPLTECRIYLQAFLMKQKPSKRHSRAGLEWDRDNLAMLRWN